MPVGGRVDAGRALRSAVVLVLAVLLGGAAVGSDGASASRAPLGSQTLLARSSGTGAITASFTHPSGTSLALTSDTCPTPWTVTGGTMTITSGRVTSSTPALVTATVPLCGSLGVDAEAGGDLHRSGDSAFGVLVNAHSSGRPATAAVYYSDPTSGTLRLQRISAGGEVITWAQVTNIGSSNIGRHFRLVYSAGVYTVSLNGATILTYPVPDAATRAAVEAHRSVGIVSLSDTKSTFDNFQAFPR